MEEKISVGCGICFDTAAYLCPQEQQYIIRLAIHELAIGVVAPKKTHHKIFFMQK